MSDQEVASPVQKYEALLAEFDAARRNRDIDINALRLLAEDVTVAKRASDAAVFEATRAEREAACSALRDAVVQYGPFETLKSLLVERVQISIDLTADSPTVSVSPSGAQIKATRKSTPKGEGDGGTRARKTYSYNGTDYDSRGLVTAFGPAHNAERTVTVLADSAKGLSHFADEVAKKLGATITQ